MLNHSMLDKNSSSILNVLKKSGFRKEIADKIYFYIDKIDDKFSPSDCWREISTRYLKPSDNFEIHKYLYDVIYKNNKKEIHPTYIPDENYIKQTNLYKFMQANNIKSYAELYKLSVTNYEWYWNKIINLLNIKFHHKYKKIIDIKNIEKPDWLVGAELNIINSCFNITDKTKPAIIYQTESDSEIKNLSYLELEKLTNRIANSFSKLNLNPNDSIAIYMPMTIEAIAIYLAIIKSGFKVVSIADSFATEEIKTRLEIANTKAIFTQDYIIRSDKKLTLYEKVKNADAPITILLPFGDKIEVDLRSQDIEWDNFLEGSSDKFESKKCNPHDHINILFSSGTTSTPKAIPWDHTSAIKSAADGLMHQDIRENDIIAWPTNLGWMMGPWLIFAAFINKASISLYYGAPHSTKFAKFIENSKTTILGLVPSLVKAWRSNNVLQDINWTNIKLFSSTGEASNSNDMFWLTKTAGYKPIIEYCGGTEISGGYVTSTVIQPNIPSTFSTKALGIDFYLIDENGNETNKGEVALVPPSIGLSRELLNKDHHKVYYQGMPKINNKILRRHGDQMEKLENGYYQALGRVDDTMNLGGIKISSAEIERALLNIDNVIETAAISAAPNEGGPDQLIIYAVVKNKNIDLDELKSIMQQSISKKLNPLFKIHEVILIDSLPRTSSNKIMRRVLRSM